MKLKSLSLIALFVSVLTQAQDPSIEYPYVFKATNNPIVKHMRTADPSCKVWADGKLWMYASHDPDDAGNNYDGMDGYHVFSTEDLETWTDHGEALHSRDVLWNGTGSMWAPDCAYKDGKYYFYFPSKMNGTNFRTGVAISDKPEGPFIPEPNFIQGTTGIDPMCFIDDDGQAYLYFGYTGSPFVAKLKNNMKELAEEMRRINIGTDPNAYVEGSFIHKYNGKYYLSWSNYKGWEWNGKKYGALYAVGDSPYGPFVFKGGIKENPPGAQDHHSIVEYHGQWYIFYHVGDYMGGNNWKRNTYVDYLYHKPDGTIEIVARKNDAGVARSLVSSAEGNSVPGTFNASKLFRQTGTTVNGTGLTSLNNGDVVEYVIDVLGTDPYTLSLDFAAIKNNGSIEIYVNNKLKNTLQVATGSETLSSSFELNEGRFLLKFVFKSGQSSEIIDINKITLGSGFNYYKITPVGSNGGTIKPDKDVYYKEGTQGKYIFSCNTGYKIDDVLVNGISKGAVKEFTFENIQSNQTIEVKYATCNSVATIYSVINGVQTEVSGSTLNVEWGGNATLKGEAASEGTWLWSGPNKFSSTDKVIEIEGETKNMGKYILNYEGNDGCVTQKEIDVKITLTAYQAEDFTAQMGIKTENCSDIFGGKNINYVENNDWAEYNIKVDSTAKYYLLFRYAAASAGGNIDFYVDNKLITTVAVTSTNGWQTWRTSDPALVNLTQGNHTAKLVFRGSGFILNLNWFKLSAAPINAKISTTKSSGLNLYPNPANSYITIDAPGYEKGLSVSVYSQDGKLVLAKTVYGRNEELNTGNLPNGLYVVKIISGMDVYSNKLIINR
jgi:arabinoxylan arabinofuranohydrolase